jgi:uncharacterized membrane protein
MSPCMHDTGWNLSTSLFLSFFLPSFLSFLMFIIFYYYIIRRRITKATDAHSEYLISFFFTVTMVARTLISVTLYVYCLSCLILMFAENWALNLIPYMWREMGAGKNTLGQNFNSYHLSSVCLFHVLPHFLINGTVFGWRTGGGGGSYWT